MAPAEPAYDKPAAAHQPVQGECLRGVRAATRREPAVLAEQRAQPTAVGPEHGQQWSGAARRYGLLPHRAAAPTSRCKAESRSSARSWLEALAAAGAARTTRVAPAGNAPTRSRSRCRSCLATRCRTTDPPTVLPTTRPIRGDWSMAAPSCAGASSKCRVSRCRDARRPRRTVAAKSLRACKRCGAASTIDSRGRAAARPCRPAVAGLPGQASTDVAPMLRPTIPRGPCDGARPGWLAQRGCACAAGSRGSLHDDGCSAGRCACSRRGSMASGDQRVTGWARGHRPLHGTDGAAPGQTRCARPAQPP